MKDYVFVFGSVVCVVVFFVGQHLNQLAHAQQSPCDSGQVRNSDTEGHCCYPGQGWNGQMCVGKPQCPGNMLASESACTCAPGLEQIRGGCCWPGQAWLSKQRRCVGEPTSCPGDLVRDGASCTCPGKSVRSGTACISTKDVLSIGLCTSRACRSMAYVPAGEFVMGSTSPYDDEQTAHMAHVEGYLIDKHEVTVAEYKHCVDARQCSYPEKSNKDRDVYNWGARDRESHPVNGVTWNQAAVYCAWKGKRLPTEAEWEKAARGLDGRMFPWGNEPPSCERAVMTNRSGHGCGTEYTSPVGSKPAGVSPYDVYDMAGNVWEWVATRERGDARVRRGGGLATPGGGLSSTYRDIGASDDAYPSLGFRCAQSFP